MFHSRSLVRASRIRHRRPVSPPPVACEVHAQDPDVPTSRRRAARQQRLRRILRDAQDDLLLEQALKSNRPDHFSQGRPFDEAQAEEAWTRKKGLSDEASSRKRKP